MQRRCLVLSTTLLVACAGTQAPPKAGAGSAGAQAPEQSPAEVLAAFTATHATPTPPPNLAQPASVDDVFEILKRDQLDLFPYGVAWASTQAGTEAKALHAQLEMAWSEACSMSAEALGEEAERKRIRSERVTAEDSAKAESLLARATELDRVSDALLVLADEHLAKGKVVAEEVIAAAPDNYLGYRVAADYYRLLHRWDDFALMVEKIEATNPESNGLVFLRGAAAAQRDFDFRAAAEFYRQALANDPKFTRAQVALMLGQEDVGQVYAEFEKLAVLNPQHHLVLWAAGSLEEDYREWQEEQAAVQR